MVLIPFGVLVFWLFGILVFGIWYLVCGVREVCQVLGIRENEMISAAAIPRSPEIQGDSTGPPDLTTRQHSKRFRMTSLQCE